MVHFVLVALLSGLPSFQLFSSVVTLTLTRSGIAQFVPELVCMGSANCTYFCLIDSALSIHPTLAVHQECCSVKHCAEISVNREPGGVYPFWVCAPLGAMSLPVCALLWCVVPRQCERGCVVPIGGRVRACMVPGQQGCRPTLPTFVVGFYARGQGTVAYSCSFSYPPPVCPVF